LPTSVYIPLVVYTLLMFCFKGFKTSKYSMDCVTGFPKRHSSFK